MKRFFSRAPVPAALLLALTVSVAAPAGAAQKTKKRAAPPAEAPAPPPPQKKPFLQKLNPFAKRDAAVPEAQAEMKPAPAPAARKGSPDAKKGAKPVPTPAAHPQAKPPVAPPPADPPPAQASTRRTGKPAPAPVAEPPPPAKKPGFFARLKNHLTEPVEDERVASVRESRPERPADWKDRWVVKEDQAAFYEFGPSQPTGPDERLAKGAVVKLVQGGRGWARVELESGRTGYLGADQLRQAGENDFAEAMAPRAPTASVAGLVAPDAWRPLPPPADLPDSPMGEGTDGALLLLPALEPDGRPLQRRRAGAEPPVLQPGDSVPLPFSPDTPSEPSPAPDTAAPPPETKPEAAPEPPAPVPSAPEPASPDPAPPAETKPETPAPSPSGETEPAAPPAPSPVEAPKEP